MSTRRLLPCESCARHVAVTETACPFCAHALAFGEPTPLPHVPGRRLKRAALFALGAGAAAVVGCGSSSVAIYGAPGTPYDAGTTDEDGGSIAPLYGAVPPDDAGTPDAGDAGDADADDAATDATDDADGG